MIESLFAFLVVSIVVIVMPGPDTAMTIRNTLLGGRAGGIATALGISTGQLIWATAASVGVVALLVASEPVFLIVKYAGAAYLVYLGSQAVIAAIWPRTLRSAECGIGTARAPTRMSAYFQGLASNLGNPKMAVFFASVLPQFAVDGPFLVSWFALLGIVFSCLTFSWLAFYAVVLTAAGRFMRQLLRRTIEAFSGAVLIALGLRLAVEQR
jgi:threonine/homoserine/homoserine lactone efflux protein